MQAAMTPLPFRLLSTAKLIRILTLSYLARPISFALETQGSDFNLPFGRYLSIVASLVRKIILAFIKKSLPMGYSYRNFSTFLSFILDL
jgi:hypothetical protein